MKTKPTHWYIILQDPLVASFDCGVRSHTSTVSFHNEFGKTIENTYNFHEQKYFRPLKNKIKWSTSKKTELKILLRRVVVIFLFIR